MKIFPVLFLGILISSIATADIVAKGSKKVDAGNSRAISSVEVRKTQTIEGEEWTYPGSGLPALASGRYSGEIFSVTYQNKSEKMIDVYVIAKKPQLTEIVMSFSKDDFRLGETLFGAIGKKIKLEVADGKIAFFSVGEFPSVP